MKSELTDNYLREIFEKDKLNCKPDPSIKNRLDYTFMLKGSQGKIYQNSFSGFFTWIFLLKGIPAKAALVTAILLFSVFNFHQKAGNQGDQTFDSASIMNIPFKLDSAFNKPFTSDTCFFPVINN